MGGSSSKQEVKVNTKAPLKNYMNEDVKQEAEMIGVDPELLAYQRQKTDKKVELEQRKN